MKNLYKLTSFILAVCIVVGVAGCTPSSGREAETIASDVWISSKVDSALIADPEVSGLDIQVETFHGVVQLSGFVETEAQVQEAIDVARSVEGVKKVISNLVVR